MQETASAFYTTKILALQTELRSIKKVLSRLYLMRLVTFLSFVAMLVFFIRSDSNSLFPLLSLFFFSAFLLAVKLDLKYVFREKYAINQLLLNQNELKILDHQYLDRETGAAF